MVNLNDINNMRRMQIPTRNRFPMIKRNIMRNNMGSIRFELTCNNFYVDTIDDIHGNTILHLAVKYKKPNIVTMLIDEYEACRLMKNRYGKTPLAIACELGHFWIIKILIQRSKEELEIADNEMETPLFKALKNRHRPIAKFLLQNGARYSDSRFSQYLYIINNLIDVPRPLRRRGAQLNFSPITQSQPFQQVLSQNITVTRHHTVYVHEDVERPLRLVSETRTEPEKKPRKEIIDMIINNYVSKKEKCPITLDDLEFETSSLTSCYHVFNSDAIITWLVNKDVCPTCRTNCIVW